MWLAPRNAQADPATEAEAAIRQGTDLRRKGDDRAALAEFQRAVRLQETPRAMAQLGLAEQALGLWVDAFGHLKRALDARNDSWIEKNRKTLEEARTTIKSRLAEVEVWGTPNGAEVRFDGVLAGTLPSVTAWVATGEVSMVVRARGHAPLTRLLSIPAPMRSREHVQLRPLDEVTTLREPPASKEAYQPRATQGSVSGSLGMDDTGAGQSGEPERAGGGVSDASSSTPPAVTETPIYQRWWFWAGIGAVAVGTGVGVYLLTRGSSTCGAPPCDSF